MIFEKRHPNNNVRRPKKSGRALFNAGPPPVQVWPLSKRIIFLHNFGAAVGLVDGNIKGLNLVNSFYKAGFLHSLRLYKKAL